MPFPQSLTTAPFVRSSTGWFEVSSCKPTSGDLLPSFVKHRKLSLAFVTHDRQAARTTGIPNAAIRAKFSPTISHMLAQLLERADSTERHYAKVTKRLVPPLVQGDVFTSLFEGAENFYDGRLQAYGGRNCLSGGAALRQQQQHRAVGRQNTSRPQQRALGR